MLLILVAIHLLSQDGIAVPLSHPPDVRATTDSCNDINSCRTLFSVVWGCLATIFACTWVSVHPNVPPPDQNWLQLFWLRLRMMLVGVIAPEVMVGFAARQFYGSRLLKKKFGFSRTHGMFFWMGGFVSPDGHPIATMEQLEDPDLGSELQKAIRKVNEKEITDKSKGDALSKGVALLQGLWFILQCLARVHQRLATTQLEIATLAFAVVNIFIWLLWWNKPLDAQWPIVVGPPTPPDSDSQTIAPVQLSWDDRILTAIFGFTDPNKYQPLSSVAVPSFWSITDTRREASILLILVGTVFGAIHCAAWNAVFPTLTEMWIWRMSSLVIAAIPGLIFLFGKIAPIADAYWGEDSAVLTLVFGVPAVLAIPPLYVAARIILIVLPLAELRSLPASAFADVHWSTYIPHI
ncbi:hypothetical protein C8R45DRAFT_1044719 [Mycena sanguinolenta]|nr:hypothetical protein C8R45DRAFT_1044719 [Mycena sanguinolenta]